MWKLYIREWDWKSPKITQSPVDYGEIPSQSLGCIISLRAKLNSQTTRFSEFGWNQWTDTRLSINANSPLQCSSSVSQSVKPPKSSTDSDSRWTENCEKKTTQHNTQARMFVEIWIFHQLSWLDSSPPRVMRPFVVFNYSQFMKIHCWAAVVVWNLELKFRETFHLSLEKLFVWGEFGLIELSWVEIITGWKHAHTTMGQSNETKRTKMNKCSTIWKEFITVDL